MTNFYNPQARPLWPPPPAEASEEDIKLVKKINRFIDSVLDREFLAQIEHIFLMKAQLELQGIYGQGVDLGPTFAGGWSSEQYRLY